MRLIPIQSLGASVALALGGCALHHGKAGSHAPKRPAGAIDGVGQDPGIGDGGTSQAEQAGNGSGAKDSLSLFAEHVMPLLVNWCSGCHATTQSPLIGNGDPQIAHEAILAAQKVDFQNPERSRLVLRLAEDQHHCPVEGCDEAAQKMLQAVTAWADGLKAPAPDSGAPRSAALRLSEATPVRINGGNPDNVIRIEAESGTFKAPMAPLDVGTASGGKVAQTPAGSGSQNNQQTATQSNALGTVTFNVDVKVAGTYRLHGLVNAPTAANNGFWVRFDNGALQGWVIPVNGALYAWDLADTNADMGTTLQFTLTAGSHRLELRQREEQTKIYTLVLTSDPNYQPVDAKPPFRDAQVLTYDLAASSGMAGLKFTVEVSDYSANAYLFKNPTLVVPSGSVTVRNLKLLINGIFLPQHATYTTVDAKVAAPGAVLSSAALVALKDKGADEDEFEFQFEVLEAQP